MNSSFYVLMMEWVPPQRRMTWAAIAQFPFSVGVLSLGLAAYLLQNWQYIQIVVALSNFLALGYVWFAPESLKWLLGENRLQEVEDISKRISKFNGITLPVSFFDEIRSLAARLAVEKRWNFSGLTPTLRRSYSVLDCFRTFHVRNFTLLCSFIWMAILIQYFGLLLLLSQITGDIYANYAISGALELIPRAVGLLLTFRLDNRTTLMSYFLVSGSLAIVAGLVPEHSHVEAITKTVVAFISRMSVVGTFALAYTFTSELFPTVIRNSGFGLCSIAMRVGSMIAPQIAALGVSSNFKGFPFLVMGAITVAASVATFLLPETKNTKLLSSIEEAEAFGEANKNGFRKLFSAISRCKWFLPDKAETLHSPSNSVGSPNSVPEIVVTFHDVVEAAPRNAVQLDALPPPQSSNNNKSAKEFTRSISSTQQQTLERRASLMSQRRFSMV
ncbi:hypothetical protein RvY_15807-2 [Ramazzottius varieornatus]|nr:hypothetical protein RvY_15807-2 [Ramazzottius varieornatus]